MDIKALGGILKRIGHFSMSNFEDRLKLQKYVYLLQAFGIYLDYRFNWYIHGPYSPGLARDGFELDKIFPNVPDVRFATAKNEKLFFEFQKFLGKQKEDTEWLEMIASIHFLKKMYPQKTKSEIFEKVMHKLPNLDKEKCEQCWEHLHDHNLI